MSANLKMVFHPCGFKVESLKYFMNQAEKKFRIEGMTVLFVQN